MNQTLQINGFLHLLSDVCISKNSDFINNDKIIIDKNMKAFLNFQNKEYENFVGSSIFYTQSPLSVAVGMTIAQNIFAERFNKQEMALVYHNIFCIVSDLATGENFDALRMAIDCKLKNLIVVYKSADARLINFYKKYGVNVAESFDELLNLSNISNMPTFISIESFVGAEDICDIEMKKCIHSCLVGGSGREKIYKNVCNAYKKKYSNEFKLFQNFYQLKSINLDSEDNFKGLALGNFALNKLSNDTLCLLGGSAVRSNNIYLIGGGDYPYNPIGVNINFEDYVDIMYDVLAGISMYDKFFVFCNDKVSNMTKLFGVKDSFKGVILLHEDVPYLHSWFDKRLNVFRPSNASEMAFAFNQSIQNNLANIILLTDDFLGGKVAKDQSLECGGYEITNCSKPNGIILASGKDVLFAKAVRNILSLKGIDIAIFSIFDHKLFKENHHKCLDKYKNIKSIVAFACEGDTNFDRYVCQTGAVIDIRHQNPEGLAKKIYAIIKRNGERSDSLFD